MEGEFTITEGGGDASRNGYWVVRGPGRDASLQGMILLHVGEVYSWELTRRAMSETRVFHTKILGQSADGEYLPTFDDALSKIREAWPREGELPPADRYARILSTTGCSSARR